MLRTPLLVSFWFWGPDTSAQLYFHVVIYCEYVIISYILKEMYNVMMVLKAKLNLFPGSRYDRLMA